MKKYRMLIAFAIVLAVIAAAYAAIVLLIPEPEVEQKESLPVYDVIDFATTEIDRVDITLKDGYHYAILGVNVPNSAGGTSRNYVIEGKDQYEYDRATLGSALLAMCDFSVNSILDEIDETDAAAMTKYGFDEPSSVMKVTPYEGDPVTVILGDPAPVGTSYYGKVEGKPEVYLISSYVNKYMLYTDKSYRVLSILSYTDTTTEIRKVMISENGEDVLGLRVRPSSELGSYTDYMTSVELLAPIVYEGNESVVFDTFLPSLQTISAVAVVEDGTQNAEKYGLTENTTVIAIENVDGTTKKITLSEPDGSGYRYGIAAGINSILLFNESDFSFVNTDYRTMMYKILWIHNIEDVQYVEMNLAGEEHRLDFEFYTDPDEELEEGEEPTKLLNAKLDGKEIVDTNGRRLYIKILSPMFYDFADEDVKRGDIEYSFKIVYLNGETYTLEFAKLNERQYAAIRDGEDLGSFVNITDLTDITKAVAKVLDGHTLSLSE